MAQNLPPVKIPDKGQKVLQTDASDCSWRAVLIERDNGEDYCCKHARGEFKDYEKYYHTIFKEILAVKKGLENFSSI